jgi:ATP-dependent Clp protease adapter protein ClpS
MSDDEEPVVPSAAALRALRAARQEATRLRHRHVTLDHLLHVLLAEESTIRILRACGCDTEHLRRELLEYLELLPGLTGRSVKEPKPDAAFTRALHAAILQSVGSGRGEFDTDGLLVAIWDAKECYASMLLGAEGLSRIELLRCISHGSPALPPLSAGDEAPPDAPVQLVLHNDHYTAMDFVVSVLGQVFSLTEKQASALMLQVHRRGRAALGPFPMAVARGLAEEVRSLAAEEEFPLLCTIEPLH